MVEDPRALRCLPELLLQAECWLYKESPYAKQCKVGASPGFPSPEHLKDLGAMLSHQIFHFFSLPAKVRTMIYRHAEVDCSPVIISMRHYPRPDVYHGALRFYCSRTSSLFLTNHKIRSEALGLFYVENTFDLQIWNAKLEGRSNLFQVDVIQMRCRLSVSRPLNKHKGAFLDDNAMFHFTPRD